MVRLTKVVARSAPMIASSDPNGATSEDLGRMFAHLTNAEAMEEACERHVLTPLDGFPVNKDAERSAKPSEHQDLIFREGKKGGARLLTRPLPINCAAVFFPSPTRLSAFFEAKCSSAPFNWAGQAAFPEQ